MDRALLLLLNRGLAHGRLDDLMVLLSTATLVVLPGLALFFLARPGSRRQALVALAALTTTLALTLLVQLAVARPRPVDVRLVLPVPGAYAYPSGHAALACCGAVLAGLICRSWRVALGCLGLAALVALSRVYLGHHHPSDLLGGALLGGAVGALFFGLGQAPGRRLRWLLWPHLALVAVVTQLAYLGLLPGWDLGLPFADKALHFALLGTLALLLHLWLDGRRFSLGRLRLPLAPVIVAGGAALEELAQALSPLRSADPLDLLCDLGGILVLGWLGELLLRQSGPQAPLSPTTLASEGNDS
jgi:membrane-associated phospholipid phosphatase